MIIPQGPKDSVVVEIGTRLVVPIIQVFALYVIFHGHYSPGGGFQGGALLAASILIQRLVLGNRRSQRGFPQHWGILFGVIGLVIFLSVAILPVFLGYAFLDYAALPLSSDPVMNRYWGILIIEIGVAFTVMGTLVSIFDLISGKDKLTI